MNTLYNLKQVATVWGATPNGFGGYAFAAPITMKCRWEDKMELIPGSTELSRAVVFVESNISPEDYIFLGDATNQIDPIAAGGSRVIRFGKVPDLRTLHTLRKVWL